jgi:protein gp37
MASTATSIEWTDATWNPVTGAIVISPGCAKCYAERTPKIVGQSVSRWQGMAPQYAKPFEALQLMADRLDAPLRWRKPRRIFVNSMSDLFHEDVPDAFIDRVFAVMALAPQHTFQVLTKRAERMREYFDAIAYSTGVDRLDASASADSQVRRQRNRRTVEAGRCRTCGSASRWRTSTSRTSGSRCYCKRRRPSGSSAPSRCSGR